MPSNLKFACLTFTPFIWRWPKVDRIRTLKRFCVAARFRSQTQPPFKDIQMPDLPKEVMCWHSQLPITHAGTWATTRYPINAVPYVPAADFERVKAAAELGLKMAEANDLWNTAETIREAIEKTSS